jgi:ABC-type transporter Mla subunit MlaD
LGQALKSVESAVDGEVLPLLKQLNRAAANLNQDLPQLIGNLNGLMVTLEKISAQEIQPTLHSMQEIAELVNQKVSEIDSLIGEINQFSKETVSRAEYYRDQLSIPITDILSLWSGVRAGVEHLVHLVKRKK